MTHPTYERLGVLYLGREYDPATQQLGTELLYDSRFNRRMKKGFDELGIEIPFPHRTLYFGAAKDGSAPPLRMAAEQK